MDSKLLSQDEFFEHLGKLFTQRKEASHGAVYLVQKRLMPDTGKDTTDDDGILSDLHIENPMPVIIRASNGKSKRNRPDKMKLATIVQPSELDAFYTRYADICKFGMTALKPRDRSKKKAKAKKKKATS